MVTLRLAVWRPAKLFRPLDYPADAESTAFEPERLQEQVYAWDPSDNDVFSALEKEFGEEFRRSLMEKFAPDLPSEKRSIGLLREVVDSLRNRLQQTTTTPWAYSEQLFLHTQDEEEVNLRVNAPLALLNHLSWISSVFANVPGASVTIR